MAIIYLDISDVNIRDFIMNVTENQIKNLCTAVSFQRGLSYYLKGRIKSISVHGCKINAVVIGNFEYKVTILEHSDNLDCRCTCQYDYGGCCKHIVAVLLHAYKKPQTMKKTYDKINDVLAGITPAQMKKFLTNEMENDIELLDRFTNMIGKDTGTIDYYSKVDAMYQNAIGRGGLVEYGIEVNFDQITEMAQQCRKRRDYEEAIRIYREMSETIAKNMGIVDDSDGYYGMCFSDAIHSMETCMNKQKDPQIRQQYISYLFKRFMLKDPDYFADYYEDALYALCTFREDFAYLEEILDPNIPNTIPNYKRRWTRHYDAVRLIMMKVHILAKTRRNDSLDNLLARHYRESHELCIRFIQRLAKSDTKMALQIAEEGMKLFPHIEEIAKIAHGLYKKTEPRYLKSLHRLFMHNNKWTYYNELKSRSTDWGDELASIISELRGEGHHDVMVEVFLREGMNDMALETVLKHKSLQFLEMYHNKLCTLYPQEYHTAYKEGIDKIARAAGNRSDYRRVKERLRKMKSVPDHKKEFNEFVDFLRNRHPRQPAFLDEIKSF